MDRCKAPGDSGEGRELGGCRGEEWPHTQSILREKQGCQEGPPWVWLSVSLHRLLPGGRRWSEGPQLSPCPPPLPLQVAHRAILGPRRGRVGTAGCWQPPELTPLWASLPSPPARHFGGKAAGRPLIGPAGRRGAAGWTRASVFNFSFFTPFFLFPQVSCFSSSVPSACSLPSPALSGCEGMFRNSTVHASR